MSERTRICLVGASGRMGAEVLANAAQARVEVVAGVVDPTSDFVGQPLGPDAVEATDDLKAAVANADVVVDFSAPAACVRAAEAAAGYGKPFVSGTTGLIEDQIDRLHAAAEQVPVLLAANFSVGVNVLENLVELAARATGEGFDLEVFEAHHRNKVDAPSGTALFLGEAAARGRGLALEEAATWARKGHTGARSADEIGFQVVRGGSIVGEHTVFLCGDGERIELTHRAQDRGIFARGALRAARWMVGRKPGRYSMKDVLFG